ncbi:MAG TPA: hypothetical protein VFD75_02340, partial [Pyrinomonadaceae bacterium]|nr:hypothetical protein [Pyrinomonadaceae bacterium]
KKFLLGVERDRAGTWRASNRCSQLNSGKFAELVQRDVDDGMKLGVKAVLTLFVNGRRVSVSSYDDQKARVDAPLAHRKSQKMYIFGNRHR